MFDEASMAAKPGYKVKCPHCTAHLRFEKNGRDSKPDDPVTCYFHGSIGTRQTVVAYAVKNRALEMVRDWQYNETAENLKQRLPDSEITNMPFDDVGTAATDPGYSVKCPHCTAKLTFEKPGWHRTPNDPVTCAFHGTIGTRLGVSRAAKNGDLVMVRDEPSDAERMHAIVAGSLSYGQIRALVKQYNASGQSDELIIAMAWQESSFQPGAENPSSRALGILQLEKTAIQELQELGHLPRNFNVYDPAKNIAAGSAYLGYLIKRSRGNVFEALIKYGESPANATKILSAMKTLQKNQSDPMQILKKDLHR